MEIINRIRLYHATLATLSILAYLTGEFGLVHAWFGYGVSGVTILRLLWALSGDRQVGLTRFYPSFDGLKLGNVLTHPAISKSLMLGIALSLLAVTLSGIAIDGGKSIGMAGTAIISPAYAEDSGEDDANRKEESLLTEAHELFANFLLLFVGLHVTYLFLFKRPLAQFMLFLPKSQRRE